MTRSNTVPSWRSVGSSRTMRPLRTTAQHPITPGRRKAEGPNPGGDQEASYPQPTRPTNGERVRRDGWPRGAHRFARSEPHTPAGSRRWASVVRGRGREPTARAEFRRSVGERCRSPLDVRRSGPGVPPPPCGGRRRAGSVSNSPWAAGERGEVVNSLPVLGCPPWHRPRPGVPFAEARVPGLSCAPPAVRPTPAG
jgi:hypothetical protein